MAASYVVSDRVDEVYRRVSASGATLLEDLHDTDFGSHSFTATDTEGNMWRVGTYRGAELQHPEVNLADTS